MKRDTLAAIMGLCLLVGAATLHAANAELKRLRAVIAKCGCVDAGR